MEPAHPRIRAALEDLRAIVPHADVERLAADVHAFGDRRALRRIRRDLRASRPPHHVVTRVGRVLAFARSTGRLPSDPDPTEDAYHAEPSDLPLGTPSLVRPPT